MAADWTEGEWELTDEEREWLSFGLAGAPRRASWGDEKGSDEGGFMTERDKERMAVTYDGLRSI